MTVGTNFILSRSLTTRNPVRIDGDTAGAYILPQTLDNSRFIEFRVTVDPHTLAQRIFGDSSSESRATVRFRPIEFTRTAHPGIDLRPGALRSRSRLPTGAGWLRLVPVAQRRGGDRRRQRNRHQRGRVGRPAVGLLRATQLQLDGVRSLPAAQRVRPDSCTTTGTTDGVALRALQLVAHLCAAGRSRTLTAGSVIERDRATSFSPFDDGSAARQRRKRSA